MRRIILVLISFSLSRINILYAQTNLVPNPGFEELNDASSNRSIVAGNLLLFAQFHEQNLKWREQQEDSLLPTVEFNHLLYIELGGKGVLASINYERKLLERKRNSFFAHLGVSNNFYTRYWRSFLSFFNLYL